MRFLLPLLFLLAASAPLAQAGPLGFGQGIGPAMIYGPYTGGHRYSYNVAYSYGFAFNSADTWRIDPVAYPAGVMPFRPFGRPILWQSFPRNPVYPPIAVIDELGLPMLRTPGLPSQGELVPVPHTALKPVSPPPPGCAQIRIVAPEGAEVFVEKEKLAGSLFQTPPLAGRMKVYSVRAKWQRDGREIEQFRVVGVQPGETAQLVFGD
ncbi:MAG: TIGR03000 domain-containing protein [Gemmataceae bacterium]